MKLLESLPVSERVLSVNTVAYSPDGRILAAGGGTLDQPGSVYVWDAATREQRCELHAYTQTVTCLAFSRDSRRLAVACQSADRVELWDVANPEAPVALPLLPEEPRRDLSGQQQTSTHVTRMAFAPGDNLLAAGCWDMRAKVWGLEGRALRELDRPHRNNVDFAAFLGDGSQLLTGTTDALFVWDLAAGQCVRRLDLDRDEHWRHVSALSSGNVLSISHAGRLRVWCVEEGSFADHALPRIRPSITAMDFCGRTRTLAMGLEDGRILFWSTETASQVGKWKMGASLVRSVAFSPTEPSLCVSLSAPRNELLICRYVS